MVSRPPSLFDHVCLHLKKTSWRVSNSGSCDKCKYRTGVEDYGIISILKGALDFGNNLIDFPFTVKGTIERGRRHK